MAAHERNNFDALRMAAACMVVVAHSYALTGHIADEPLVRHTALEDLGGLGVSIFFVLSGFLVTGSYMKRPNLPAFLGNRGLRLLPALAVVTFASALLIGPVVSVLPLARYLASPMSWAYPIRNLLIYPVAYALPGVFTHNPYPDVVNGSLWTLRLEVSFYLVVAFLGWRRQLRFGVLAAGCAALALAHVAIQGFSLAAPLPVVLAVRYGLLFFAGAAAAAWGGASAWQGRRGWGAALAAFIIVAAIAGQRPWAMTLLPLLLPVIVLGVGLNPIPVVHAWGRIGDLSYGVYLWAFPVQQLLIRAEGPGVAPPVLAVQCLAIVVPIAAASWWLIERPALGLKRALHARLTGFDDDPLQIASGAQDQSEALVPLD